ncbi:MAG TPA: hypothetical protein VLJ44_10650, partial [Gaiellaceae bacterium]|nr:hypothetical protein [Gaiellaceae bacterium]
MSNLKLNITMSIDGFVAGGGAFERRHMFGGAHVPERDRCIAAQPARIVARHVQAVVRIDDRPAVRFEPRDQVDVAVAGRLPGAAFLDPAVPRAHVLADVA